MKLSQIALMVAASGFAGFGIACLTDPKILNRVDVRAGTRQARTELRAMYGGLEVGLGAFFLAAAFTREWQQPALIAQALGLGTLAASRTAGIVHDRPHGALMKALAVAEGSAAALAVVGLVRERALAGKLKRAA